uniref:Uncharacterized protein n=1 Tax=Vibrio vulnificus TaxID=672 RepID=A0A6S4Q0M4_VIBVL|nr:hypothetical protein [Vibrio vulnificus]
MKCPVWLEQIIVVYPDGSEGGEVEKRAWWKFW